ncbi:MAG: biopolymer transporter ExbD [Bacteroidales bacterium]|jgi:biopolymer transport protein ExbD|nr:biopolymer transporter ExbD [Bacteroidales bacterium]MDD2687416.1 biopolymer transporter ExbD [Bacteroidales bacterium]MDD3330081.1 biopolymer transporter ExbD [Bacteroidales bacterium]MDD3691307.1 biopolymer transporter ExbD [Bacteroidales bacterium]MDD4044071.1 biopolymer transporter ExbD [Bacteroidales bacterium]
MPIRVQNKRNIEFNLSTQADLVFLLLIFFMITSTFVSPNAIKLLLPESTSKTMAKQNFEVYIDENLEYAIKEGKDLMAVEESLLASAISERLMQHQADATVVVRADKSVPVQNIVYVIDAVNGVNDMYQRKHKVILATANVSK